METGNETESVGWVEIGYIMLICTDTALVESNFRSVGAFDQKAVDDLGFAADDADFVIIKEIVGFHLVHHGADGKGLMKKDDSVRAVFGDPQADPDSISAVRF